MAEQPKTSGVQSTEDIRRANAAVDELVLRLMGMGKTAKDRAKTESDLQKAVAAVTKAQKGQWTETQRLVNIFRQLKKGSGEAASTMQDLASEYSKSMDVMSEAQLAAFNDERQGLQEIIKSRRAAGASGRDLAILQERGRQFELKAFQDHLGAMGLQAKALQAGGAVLRGTAGAGIVAAASGWLKVVETIGPALGMTSSAMLKLATAGTLLAAPLVLLFGAFKGSQEAALEMAQANYELGGSWSEASARGAEFRGQVASIAEATYTVSGKAQMFGDRLRKLLPAFEQAGGSSLVAVGASFKDIETKGTDARNSMRAMGMGFVHNVSMIGATFGMAGEQAVEAATKLGVAGRANSSMTIQVFTRISGGLQKMMSSFGAMQDSMIALAETAANSGESLNSAGMDLMAITGVVRNMGQSNLKMFQNMSPAHMERFTNSFTKFLLNIEDEKLAAMTYKNSQSFGDMVKGVVEMGTGGRIQAIAQLMQSQGLKNNVEGQFVLGKMLGATGTWKDIVGMGALGMESVKGGGGFAAEKQLAQQMAMRLEKADARRGIGENLLMGANPMETMLAYVKRIMEILESGLGGMMFGTPASKGAATPVTVPVPQKPAKGYGTEAASRSRMGGSGSVELAMGS